MTSPHLELQGAIVSILNADASVKAALGNPPRLYMDVPSPVTLPYAVIGEAQGNNDKAECVDGWEMFVNIDVWAEGGGDQVIKEAAAAISDALDDADVSLSVNRCVLFERDNVIFRRANDGITRHAILTFRALVEGAN